MPVTANANAAGPPSRAVTEHQNESFVLAKVAWRILPFLFLLYVVNLIDRTNIGIARRQMLPALHMNDAAYGLGASLFAVGYLLFEVPSNLVLVRVGARRWIARILITWGFISACMMFVQGAKSFYAMRILLGAAEAGFFPGIILYLSRWFPAHARARAVALFMIAGLVSGLIGNPISGFILDHTNGIASLAGWQWVYLLEGIPAVILGFVTYGYMTDTPQQAKWLTPLERDLLVDRMEQERLSMPAHHRTDLLRQAVLDPRVWLLTGIYFTVSVGDNTFGYYLPAFVESRFPKLSNFGVGLLAALPNLISIAIMIGVAHHSDRTGERRWHIATCAFAAAAGWASLAIAPTPWIFVAALTLTLAGMKSMLPTFWSLPTSLLGGTTAAAVIALINSVANTGGFFGPMIVGRIKTWTGSFTLALLMVAVVLATGGVVVAANRRLLSPRVDVPADPEIPTVPPN